MNKIEELRIQQMKRLGCVACAHIGIPMPFVEVHHLLEGGRRMGDWFTIPLCVAHHRGGEWSEAIPEKYRVSIAGGRKLFMEVFPTERQMWDSVQDRLGLNWPISKAVPRRVA